MPAPPHGRMRYRIGADRLIHPVETLRRMAPVARAIGVTRLADLTGLDRIDLPVFQAVRPLALSLSVSQGKGATRVAAQVSALMEAIELHHAEQALGGGPRPADDEEAEACAALLPPPGRTGPFEPARMRRWSDAVDLTNGRPIGVPLGLVSMDFTRPREPDLWPSSNGLASGNTLAEADVAALCELIERDAHARWLALTPAGRRATAIGPDHVEDRLGRVLLGRIAAAGLTTHLYDLTDDRQVPVSLCVILDTAAGMHAGLRPCAGAGCHPNGSVALARAVTEAVQSRVTLIAGARDDICAEDYLAPGAARLDYRMETLAFGKGGHRRRAPSARRFDTSEAARDWLVERLYRAGARWITRVDLTCPTIGVPVVKIVVPGLGDSERGVAPSAPKAA